MSRFDSDLVRDARLATQSLSVDKVRHTVWEPNATGFGRRVRRNDVWKRRRMLGTGGFGMTWFETCIGGPSKGQVRAVKSIKYDEGSSPISLEAYAKFSQARVRNIFTATLDLREKASSVLTSWISTSAPLSNC